MAQGKNTVFKLIGAELHMQFTGDGAGELSVMLDHYQTRAKDFSPAFGAFDKQVMMPGIQKTFSQGGRPNRWHPLAESTQRQRVAEGYGGASPILVRSGALKKGFRSRIGKRSYAVFNRVFYYPYHQFGAPNLPARPMVVVLTGQRRLFTEIVRKYMGMES